jgi:DNA-directed RNA polymerase specialized sigma24 family protein
MNQHHTLQSLDLHELARECANQEALYRKLGGKASDPRVCYELFRRAVVQKDEAAWSLVYQQYEPQVLRWIRQHPAFASAGKNADDFVSEVFARFWRAVSPDKFSKQLQSLGAVLLYLKKCVASTLYSHQRALKKDRGLRALEEIEIKTKNPAAERPVEHYLAQEVDAEQLWRSIEGILKDDRERAAMENYVLEKKARQIRADYAHLFDDAKSIYRVKENLLKRFRRNRNLRTWRSARGGKEAASPS